MSQSSSNSAKIKSTPYPLRGRPDGYQRPLQRFVGGGLESTAIESPKIPNSTIKNEKCADSGETIPESFRTLPSSVGRSVTGTDDRMPSVDKYFNMFGAGGGKYKK